jgi:hypothetical protein
MAIDPDAIPLRFRARSARRRARFGSVLAGALLLGLLIWAKLLLVTDYPRTAIATPAPAKQPEPAR